MVDFWSRLWRCVSKALHVRECLVPAGLQFAGHEPIVWVYRFIAECGRSRLVSRVGDLQRDRLAFAGVLTLQVIRRLKGRLHRVIADHA
jgi:hypothetical protein